MKSLYGLRCGLWNHRAGNQTDAVLCVRVTHVKRFDRKKDGWAYRAAAHADCGGDSEVDWRTAAMDYHT